MILQTLIFGSVILGVALFFSVSLYLTARRNPKLSASRIFLKRGESLKAMRLLVGGLSIFVLGRAIEVLSEMGIIPRVVYVLAFASAGTLCTLCPIYSLHKLETIIKRR
ncbi:hypothetical protein J7L18_00735 [Candidatus Bathyarchaeota archaeon]|nr:hypothetical protein [Candidatus Bathyarchaeota archaeon]